MMIMFKIKAAPSFLLITNDRDSLVVFEVQKITPVNQRFLQPFLL